MGRKAPSMPVHGRWCGVGGESTGWVPRAQLLIELGDFGQVTLLPDPQMSHLENGYVETDDLHNLFHSP